MLLHNYGRMAWAAANVARAYAAATSLSQGLTSKAVRVSSHPSVRYVRTTEPIPAWSPTLNFCWMPYMAFRAVTGLIPLASAIRA